MEESEHICGLIIQVAVEAISRERYAFERMKEYGVTREGLGLSKEPAICNVLNDLIKAAKNMDLTTVRCLIDDIDIITVKEELLQVLE